MNPKKIIDTSKITIPIQQKDILVCCYCDKEYAYEDGYDEQFCCEDCCLNQEDLNVFEGRVEDVEDW